MAQIGSSWVSTSWAIPAWAANTWYAPVSAPAVGQRVVPNTVARLGALFKKTILYSNYPQEPSLAVKKFLEGLKTERKKLLTAERKTLASLKTEKRKVEEAPHPKSTPVPQRVAELDIQIQNQSQVVRDARKLYEEAERAFEQERIDQLAEYARQEWMREESERKAEAERLERIQEAKDDEMSQILLLVHDL